MTRHSIPSKSQNQNRGYMKHSLRILFFIVVIGVSQNMYRAHADDASSAQSTSSITPDIEAKVEALTNAGADEMAKNNFPAAISNFKEALSLDPSCGVARRNLSAALSNQGTGMAPEEGVTYWRKALFIWSENKPAHNNLSTFLRSIGKAPDSFEDRLSLANSFAKSGDYVSAVVELREALACKKDVAAEAKLNECLKKAPALPN